MTDPILKRVQKVRFDPSMDAYRSFFDNQWSKEVRTVSQGTKLEEPVDRLRLSWRGAASAHSLPWQMMRIIKKVLEDFETRGEPAPLKWVRGVAERLTSKDPSLTRKQRDHLRNLLVEVERKARLELPNHPPNFETEIRMFWKDMITAPEFVMSLWKSEQNVFAATYYAYEDFVACCTGLALRKPAYRIPQPALFRQDFTAAFDEVLYEASWSCDEICMSRLIRNAIVHNGGRMTAKLEHFRSKLDLEDDDIVVLASDCDQLYTLLKGRALALAKATVKKS